MERHVRSVHSGALLDVSGSMQRSFGRQQATETASFAAKNKWVRSIFRVADQLVKNDVSPTNQVFMGGVGANQNPEVFDILASLQEARRKKQEYEDRIKRFERRSKQNKIDEVLSILESSGASRVRKWTTADVISKEVDDHTASAILDALQTDKEFKMKLVHEFLPEECRKYCDSSELKAATPTVAKVFAVASLIGTIVMPVLAPVAVASALASKKADEKVQQATEKNVTDVVEKCKSYLEEKLKIPLVPLTPQSVFSPEQAQKILHSCNEKAELTDQRVTELIDIIEPYIYGGTPLMQAVQASVNILSKAEYKPRSKLLFILSDGEPSDDANRKEDLFRTLQELDVTVVSCFITDQNISDPRRLYSKYDRNWDGPAKFMFDISSTVKTDKIPRTLFVRKGWTIDTENNETKLFFQINHPDLIDEVCDVAKKCVCSQDALSDVLSKVDLDLYINRANEGFEPKRQSKLTCYAVASATVIHLSMRRIVGRDGGYPDFYEVRDKIVAKFGENRARTVDVLSQVCPEYRLKCQKVDESAALEAIIAKRPVVATFRLTRDEWAKFKQFFMRSPAGVLTKSELDISHRATGAETFGHAVVLMSFDRHSLRLLNSWPSLNEVATEASLSPEPTGSKWGDGGFFRVQSADVIGMEFIDVSWDRLSEAEKKAFKESGPRVAEKLFSSLKGLQTSRYRCPLCQEESSVSEFTGHTVEATCPRCKRSFNANLAGSDLALNLYLTSLLHKQEP